jgi:phosphate transport system permease protein
MHLGRLPMRRRLQERAARAVLVACSLVAVAMLVILLWRVGRVGIPLVDWQFLTSFSSRNASEAGVKAALIGSLWLGALTMAISLPLGVLAAVYLHEYAPVNRLTLSIRMAIANLAGTPSIVFGLLGFAVFVRFMGLGTVLLAGALTLAILVLPIVIVATEEALRAVPKSIREAAYGLGATRLQVTKDHVLPYAAPGIFTGSILALGRAMGETAPLILVGGATAIFFLPDTPLSQYTALPLLTFFWAANSNADIRSLAAAGTVVLLLLILTINLAAILLRNKYGKRLQW